MGPGLCAHCLAPLQSNNIITKYYFFPPFNPSLHHLPSRQFYFFLTGDPNWTGSSFRSDLFEMVDWNSMISSHHVMFLSKWQLKSGLFAVHSSVFSTAGRLQQLWRAFGSWIAIKKPPGEKRCNFIIKEAGKTFERMNTELFFISLRIICDVKWNLHACTMRQYKYLLEIYN